MSPALGILGRIIRRSLLVRAVKSAHRETPNGWLLASATRAFSVRGALTNVFIQRFEYHCSIPVLSFRFCWLPVSPEVCEIEVFRGFPAFSEKVVYIYIAKKRANL
jgi:hypothetical protein